MNNLNIPADLSSEAVKQIQEIIDKDKEAKRIKWTKELIHTGMLVSSGDNDYLLVMQSKWGTDVGKEKDKFQPKYESEFILCGLTRENVLEPFANEALTLAEMAEYLNKRKYKYAGTLKIPFGTLKKLVTKPQKNCKYPV